MECNDVIEINGVTYRRETPMSAGYVIVRTYSAGVFMGILVRRDGKEVELKDARRLWRWSGAASLSQLAMEGVKDPDGCKFPQPVRSVVLTEAIEILTCTHEAVKSVMEVPEWKR